MAHLDKRADRLDQVSAQVDYHRQRLALYQRLHGTGPSARLTELERAYRMARERLAVCTPQAGAVESGATPGRHSPG
jgi:hypothetical protein